MGWARRRLDDRRCGKTRAHGDGDEMIGVEEGEQPNAHARMVALAEVFKSDACWASFPASAVCESRATAQQHEQRDQQRHQLCGTAFAT